MSTHCVTLVMYGIKLNEEEYRKLLPDGIEDSSLAEFAFDEYSDIEENRGIRIVTDGMSGEYCLIGNILAMSDSDEDGGNLDYIEIENKELDELIMPLVNFIDKNDIDMTNKAFKIMALSHYY
ncbi:MAG: hypothetical protein WC444_05995 [Candidatus Paceibacterota bacterium]